MPAVQSTYNVTMRPAIAGMVADMSPRTVVSRIVEGVAGLGFGVVAVKGTGDRQVKASAAATAFIGITIMDPTVAPGAVPTTPDQYQEKDVCAVLQRGTVWVVAGATVVAGEQAYFVPATGVITNSSSGNTAIPGGFFDTSAASSALAILRIR